MMRKKKQLPKNQQTKSSNISKKKLRYLMSYDDTIYVNKLN